jgi:Mg-chelatase subunit ChlD
MQLIGIENILGFAFITPTFFVAGLLFAGIPILIHILNRRRYKTVPWAAMEFLLRAMRKNRRRLKFEQWLLLAARCLVMLLVATALARPLGCRESTFAGLTGTRSGLHVFVIDNSYSMAYEADRSEARTHLDQAKLLAKEQIKRLSAGGEAVAIVTASRPAAPVLAAPTYDLAAASSAVNKIEQSFAATDIPGALRAAAEIGKQEKAQFSKTLHILTDGTRSAWEPSEAEALAQTGKELATVYKKVTHFNLGRQGQWNQAALGLRPAGNLVTSKFNNDFLAQVQAFGSGADPVAQWKLDDQVLPGGGHLKMTGEMQTLAQAGLAFRAGGAHVVTLNLAGEDRLKLDNQRWRVVNVVDGLKVLMVEGERGVGRLTGSGSLLSLALAPPRENVEATTQPGGKGASSGKSENYIAPEVISDLELPNRVLTDYRTVILTAVGQVAPAIADQLALFVKQGGTLMVFLGEPVVAQNYNEVLLSRGLLPGALAKRMNAGVDQGGFYFDFKPRGNLHPLLRVFEGEENSGLDTAQIFTYWQMDVKPDAKAERVLNYLPAKGTSSGPSTNPTQSEDPAITVHPLGSGRVVVVTTTANAEWTTLPVKPAYLPLMHELLSGSVSASDAWMNLTVGQKLEVPTNLKLTAALTLVDAAQKEVVLEPLSGGPVGYRSGPINRPGVYRLVIGNQSMPIAVNVPADEADVRTVDNKAIKKALGDIDVELESDQLPAEVSGAASVGEDYGWPLMMAALLLVGAECWMAMRFGHYRR